MDININSLNALAAAKSSSGDKVTSSKVLDKDAFLELLVTQLRHQNPLKPLSNAEFVAQTAQFSSLEEMQTLNKNMKALLSLQESSSRTAAVNLIGKKVVFKDSTISPPNGSPVARSYKLPVDADVIINIFDGTGNLVRAINNGKQAAGEHSFTWDGLNDEGMKMPQGSYTYGISALDASGNEVQVSGKLPGIVDGVMSTDDGIYVSIGGKHVALSDVNEIWGSAQTN